MKINVQTLILLCKLSSGGLMQSIHHFFFDLLPKLRIDEQCRGLEHTWQN